MAQSSLTSRKLAVAALTALVAGILVFLLASPLGIVEDRVTGLRYAFRGDQQADTNIVIVYIDDDAVRVTGWPVRRSYAATALSVLHELRVRAIGIEMLFEDPRPEYPEYDEFLGSAIRSSANVVLTSYFDSLVTSATSVHDTSWNGSLFRYAAVSTPAVSGSGYHSPLPLFMNGAAGVGHVNFTDDMGVPVLVGAGESVVPAFPLELLRVSLGVERGSVFYDGRTVSLRKRNVDVEFSTTPDGRVTLFYSGGLRSFTAYRLLDLLMSYEAAKSGGREVVTLSRLRDKIVLVGVIAEGRSQVFATPVDPRYPSIGLHATFLDNALHSRFLHEPGTLWMVVLSVFMALVCGVAILFIRSPLNVFAAIGEMAILVLASFLLFAKAGFVLPLVGPLACGVIGTIRALLYRHRLERDRLHIAAKEKDAVIAQLRDKEARLAVLERELIDGATAPPPDRTNDLLEEIRKYKAEIRALSSQADDMVEYHPEDARTAALEFEGTIYARGGRMKGVVEFVEKIASSDAPVLILGESGTGKELIAHAIHKRSSRRDGPFIAVNCGALTETLLESELFGHEKGAFTGAVKERIGRFELADGGTDLLDEIGEVSDSFQVKMLRVLQEGDVERVGGTKTIHLNVRVVAATNKDLKEQVRLRRFREDLYYRLNVLAVELPPLRERSEDIPLLIEHFLRREGAGLQVSKNVMDALQNYSWPGNIRELEGVITRGAVLARAEKRSLLTVNDLSEDIVAVTKQNFPIQEQILELLRQKGFSRSSVSETGSSLGGLNRGTIAEYLRGECLKTFVEQQFDLERAVKYISLSGESGVNERVRKKFLEYLSNIMEGVDKSQTWEGVKSVLRSKMKNLPQRYHSYLEQTAEAYFRGVWKLPDERR